MAEGVGVPQVNNINHFRWLTFNFGRTVLQGAFCDLANAILGSRFESQVGIRSYPNMPAKSGARAVCVPAKPWTAEGFTAKISLSF